MLSMTVTVADVLFAVTRSIVLSPFRSAAASATGEFPVGREMGALNVPSPFPISMSTLAADSSATREIRVCPGEIRGNDSGRAGPGGISRLREKSSVAIAQQDRNGAVSLVGYGQIGMAVVVEIRRRNARRRRSLWQESFGSQMFHRPCRAKWKLCCPTEFVTARSTFPSALKSAVVIADGDDAHAGRTGLIGRRAKRSVLYAVYFVAEQDGYRAGIRPSPWLTTARSGCPSPSKSWATRATGLLPVG